MPRSTKIGIVYGDVSGTVRRIIVPDTDGELNPQAHVQVGEQILIVARMDLVTKSGLADLDACTAAVEAVRGVPSLSAVNNLTDKSGTVVATVLADPAIDAAPDGLTIARPAASSVNGG